MSNVECPSSHTSKCSLSGEGSNVAVNVFGAQVNPQTLSPNVSDAFPDEKKRECAVQFALSDPTFIDVAGTSSAEAFWKAVILGYKSVVDVGLYIKQAVSINADFQEGHAIQGIADTFSLIGSVVIDSVSWMKRASVLVTLASLAIAFTIPFIYAYENVC